MRANIHATDTGRHPRGTHVSSYPSARGMRPGSNTCQSPVLPPAAHEPPVDASPISVEIPQQGKAPPLSLLFRFPLQSCRPHLHVPAAITTVTPTATATAAATVPPSGGLRRCRLAWRRAACSRPHRPLFEGDRATVKSGLNGVPEMSSRTSCDCGLPRTHKDVWMSQEDNMLTTSSEHRQHQ